MSQAYLAGGGDSAAADHARVADRVMRWTKRPSGHKRLIRFESAKCAINSRGLQALRGCERRQDAWQTPRQHRLACPWRTDHQHVMTTGGRHDHRAFGELLTANVREINLIGV